ncbi:hypothetical protein [Chryseobacterium oryctis]|uniref:Uncharacterized protein n=1 Tax=Chryseobacterium oryctis TaxID=2952618 RepID=A0ABT3HN50_9FLAO|nr:hypothetical protein [Chryseobacterium oryctis]MCW3161174.1 hypothetical protein [Chryseobacterium oryctis]
MPVTKNVIELKPVMREKDEEMKFSEVRRLNKDIHLEEYMVLQSFEEIVKLYSLLEDKRFSRSEPIPVLAENEFLLLLKPKLKTQLYADIEVMRVEEEKSVLNVYYKEINNEEYKLNKEKDPILILKIEGVIPSKVKLIAL